MPSVDKRSPIYANFRITHLTHLSTVCIPHFTNSHTPVRYFVTPRLWFQMMTTRRRGLGYTGRYINYTSNYYYNNYYYCEYLYHLHHFRQCLRNSTMHVFGSGCISLRCLSQSKGTTKIKRFTNIK